MAHSRHAGNNFLVGFSTLCLAVGSGSQEVRVVVVAQALGLLSCGAFFRRNENPIKKIRKVNSAASVLASKRRAKLEEQKQKVLELKTSTEEWIQAEKANQLEQILSEKERLEQEVQAINSQIDKTRSDFTLELESSRQQLVEAQETARKSLSEEEERLKQLEKQLFESAQAMVDQAVSEKEEAEKVHQSQLEHLYNELDERDKYIRKMSKTKKAQGYTGHESIANALIQVFEDNKIYCDYVSSMTVDGCAWVRLTFPQEAKSFGKIKGLLSYLHGTLDLGAPVDMRQEGRFLDFKLSPRKEVFTAIPYRESEAQAMNPEPVPVQINGNRTAHQANLNPESLEKTPFSSDEPTLSLNKGSGELENEFPEPEETEINALAEHFMHRKYTNFVEPKACMSASGVITPVEKDWIVYCYLHAPEIISGIQGERIAKYGMNESNVILTVYGAKKGGSAAYISARAKFIQVKEEYRLGEVKQYLKNLSKS